MDGNQSGEDPPGGHEDVGNVWRKVLLCEGVPDKGQTIKCRLLCSGCGSLKWAWHSRFADGLKIHSWLYNSCRTSGDHICVGHTGISSIPFALSCEMFCTFYCNFGRDVEYRSLYRGFR